MKKIDKQSAINQTSDKSLKENKDSKKSEVIRKQSVDPKKTTQSAIKPQTVVNKKSKIIPDLENDNISYISKNNVSSQNETNMIINENLNKATLKPTNLSDKTKGFYEKKEIENLKSLLVQYHYANALLDDTYSQQQKSANVLSLLYLGVHFGENK